MNFFSDGAIESRTDETRRSTGSATVGGSETEAVAGSNPDVGGQSSDGGRGQRSGRRNDLGKGLRRLQCWDLEAFGQSRTKKGDKILPFWFSWSPSSAVEAEIGFFSKTFAIEWQFVYLFFYRPCIQLSYSPMTCRKPKLSLTFLQPSSTFSWSSVKKDSGIAMHNKVRVISSPSSLSYHARFKWWQCFSTIIESYCSLQLLTFFSLSLITQYCLFTI